MGLVCFCFFLSFVDNTRAQTPAELKDLLLAAPFREFESTKWIVEQSTFGIESLKSAKIESMEANIESLVQSGHAPDSLRVMNERSYLESFKKLPDPVVETIDVEVNIVSPSRWMIGVYPRQLERKRGREFCADGDGLVYEIDRGARAIQITDTVNKTLSDVLRGLPQFLALETLPMVMASEINATESENGMSLRYTHPLFKNGEITLDLDPESFGVFRVTEIIDGKKSRIAQKTGDGFECNHYDLSSGKMLQSQKWCLISSLANPTKILRTKPDIPEAFGVSIQTSKVSIRGLDSKEIRNKTFDIKSLHGISDVDRK